MTERTIEDYRYFLKDSIRQEIEFHLTDQNQGVPPPPIQRPPGPGKKIIDLPNPSKEFLEQFDIPLARAIDQRRSVRQFSDEPLTLSELSFLLWSTQGIRSTMGNTVSLRTVPSAGARHSFDTYLAIRNVVIAGEDEGVESESVGEINGGGEVEKGSGGGILSRGGRMKMGIYRYLPITHQLVFERMVGDLGTKLAIASLGQRFVGEGAVTFLWTTTPYRMEWRYGLAAHKVIAIDVGHVCQNLYLACEAIGAGTCAIGAYDQEQIDELLGLNTTEGMEGEAGEGGNMGKRKKEEGEKDEEFVLYLAPVGKKR